MIQLTENIRWNKALAFENQAQETKEWYYTEIYPLLCLSKNRMEEGRVIPEWDHLERPVTWKIETGSFVVEITRIYKNRSDWAREKDIITIKEKEV